MRATTIGVLGGSGFVGRHIVQRLAAQQRRVRILTRHRERHRDLLVLPTVELVEANIHDEEALTRYLQGCDAVINLVGILNERGHDGSGFRRAHVELPRKVLEACRRNAIPRLLHMSALNADAAQGRSLYLRSKGEGENLAHQAAGEGIHTTSFRPSVIFGPEDSFFNRFGALLRLSPIAFPIACPGARFAPVYVGDVADAFVKVLDDPTSFGKHYDLCGPHVYTLKELLEYAAKVMGLKRKIIGLSDGLSRLQAGIMEYVPGKPFSKDNYLSLQTDSVCKSDGLTTLGINPTPLEAVVPQYLGQRTARARYSAYRRRARRD